MKEGVVLSSLAWEPRDPVLFLSLINETLNQPFFFLTPRACSSNLVNAEDWAQ